MRLRRRNSPSGLVRALIGVCLLAGVFAMHGLTGNHGAAMALTHRMAATSSASVQPETHQESAKPALPAPEHHAPADPPVAAGAFAQFASTLAGSSEGIVVGAARDGHNHSMGDVCLAMLAALALAIIAALARRSLRVTHPVAPFMPAQRRITPGPSPPWLQPTLPKLCVLRT